MTPKFWKGRRVFLTGHTGFKGAWLSLWLEHLGAVVHGYALKPKQADDLFNVARISDGLEHQIADIRDLDTLKSAIDRFAPEIVIHMAAQSLVRRSYEVPTETYAVNVMGTANVLEAVRSNASVRAIIIVTSDKCYENEEGGQAFVETDAMGGRDPYSSSKGAAELVTAGYAHSFFGHEANVASVASVRAGNAIGGGDWAQDRILPDIFRGLLSGGPVFIRNPAAIRPWQHVLEPLSGYLTVGELLLRGKRRAWEAWNFGPDASSEQPVETLAQTCCALWGRPDALCVTGRPETLPEAMVLRLDSSKARKKLGWKPRWNFEETLKQSVDWYRRFGAGEDMRTITLQQIEVYISAK